MGEDAGGDGLGQVAPAVDLLHGPDKDALADGSSQGGRKRACHAIALVGDSYSMTVVADNKHRVTLRHAKPGDRFDVSMPEDGKYILTKLVPRAEPKRIVARLAQAGGGLFLQLPKGYTLAPDAIEQAVAEERASR